MPHVVAGSQIMREIVPKKGHGARESFEQRDLRLPFQNRPNAAVVRIVIADVNAFAVRRKGTDLVSSAAVHFDEQVGKGFEADHALASQVEHFAVGLLADLLRSEEHTSELQSRSDLVCRLLLE